MTMYFDPKTRKTTGELTEITSKEVAYLNELVKAGIMISTKYSRPKPVDASQRDECGGEGLSFEEALAERQRQK